MIRKSLVWLSVLCSAAVAQVFTPPGLVTAATVATVEDDPSRELIELWGIADELSTEEMATLVINGIRAGAIRDGKELVELVAYTNGVDMSMDNTPCHGCVAGSWMAWAVPLDMHNPRVVSTMTTCTQWQAWLNAQHESTGIGWICFNEGFSWADSEMVACINSYNTALETLFLNKWKLFFCNHVGQCDTGPGLSCQNIADCIAGKPYYDDLVGSFADDLYEGYFDCINNACMCYDWPA